MSNEQPKPQTTQVKLFIYGSVGLLIMLAASFIFGVFILFFNSKTPEKEMISTATLDFNDVQTPEQLPDPLITKAPERQKAIAPSITFIDPQLGPANAPITFVEYSDFQCPYCAQVQPIIKQILEKYPGKIKLVWKNLPIKQLHPTAELTAQAALCAGEQDKFWQYHDLLFANQEYFTSEILTGFAKQLDLDISGFSVCLSSGKMSPRVGKTLQEAADLNIDSTPHFYINNQEISGADELENFERVIEIELNK